MQIRDRPCPSCPYVVNTPSGVWDRSEYEKLPLYDLPTEQQPFGVFLCHDGDAESILCCGWYEVHSQQTGPHDLLSLRIAESLKGFRRDSHQPSGANLHASGRAACDAGLRDIDSPSEAAQSVMRKIERKPTRKGGHDE